MGISLEKVSYSYNPKKQNTIYQVFDISLNIDKNDEFIALVGETGSGKSTLATIFNALKVPTVGDATICGVHLMEKRKRKDNYNNIRKQVGLVFQFPDYQLFEETVIKDVMYGPKNFGMNQKEAEESARKSLELVHFPNDSYDKSPFILSGGEKKMASIAGILASNPDILVLDEPTAGLDPETKDKLLNVLLELNNVQHKTVIIITHDMNIVYQYAKRVLVMNSSRLIFDGTPRSLFLDNKDLVHKANLDFPDTITLSTLLNDKCGLNLRADEKSINELCEEILQ